MYILNQIVSTHSRPKAAGQEALTTNPSGALNNLFAGIGSAWNGYQFANGAANPYGNMQKSVNNNSRYGGTISY